MQIACTVRFNFEQINDTEPILACLARQLPFVRCEEKGIASKSESELVKFSGKKGGEMQKLVRCV